MRKSILSGIIPLLVLGAIQSAPRAGGRAFMELEGAIVHLPKESGTALFRITRIVRMGGSESGREVGRLIVQCPIELQPWQRTFTLGDTLELEWRVDAEPTRGWLFWGGKPGRASLRVPKDGMQIACSCSSKRGPLAAPLFVAFVNPDGSTTSELEFKGRSEFPLLRILPFWGGQKAKANGILRLRCGWDPASVGLKTA